MFSIKKKNNVEENKPMDFILCITVFLLLAMGIIMVLSASAPSSFAESGNSYAYVTKQAVLGAVRLGSNVCNLKNRL